MDLNGLEDLLLPEDQKDTIESFEDVVEYEMGDPTEDKNSKIFYLDDDHNIVDEKDATKSVIQVYDDEGNMVEEVWSFLNRNNENEQQNTRTVVVYVDEDGVEVPEEDATHIVYKTYDEDNDLVSENKYPLRKEPTL